MTIEYAIRILDPETSRDALWKYEDKEDRLKVVNEACRVAVDALRAQCDAPLTLEELREMDGEPVYTVALDYGRNRWSFVSADCELVRFYTTRRGVACDVIGRYFKTYGKTWLAYRRKPEEVTP